MRKRGGEEERREEGEWKQKSSCGWNGRDQICFVKQLHTSKNDAGTNKRIQKGDYNDEEEERTRMRGGRCVLYEGGATTTRSARTGAGV